MSLLFAYNYGLISDTKQQSGREDKR